MKVYVVMGSTGEYSDRTDWPVAAYREEEKAQKHVQLATVRANEISSWRGSDGENWSYTEDPSKPVNEFDPRMIMYSNEASYFLSEADLLDEVPASQEQS